jgi:hypothetical protein
LPTGEPQLGEQIGNQNARQGERHQKGGICHSP